MESYTSTSSADGVARYTEWTWATAVICKEGVLGMEGWRGGMEGGVGGGGGGDKRDFLGWGGS